MHGQEGTGCWCCQEYWGPFGVPLWLLWFLRLLWGLFVAALVSLWFLWLLCSSFGVSLWLLCGFCVVSLWSNLISKETAEGGCSPLRFQLSRQTPLLVSLLQPRCTVGAFPLPTGSCWTRLVLP